MSSLTMVKTAAVSLRERFIFCLVLFDNGLRDHRRYKDNSKLGVVNYVDQVPAIAEIWSSLFTLPTLVVALAAALVGFLLTRLGHRLDARSSARADRPSRRAERKGRGFSTKLATRRPNFVGPKRWKITFDPSLEHYEIEQHGPDSVHNLRLDFFDTSKKEQKNLNPTIRFAIFPAGIPLSMPLGAWSRIQNFGVAIRWDDQYGTDQFDRLLIREADPYRL